jgi:hypothetical protein
MVILIFINLYIFYHGFYVTRFLFCAGTTPSSDLISAVNASKATLNSEAKSFSKLQSDIQAHLKALNEALHSVNAPAKKKQKVVASTPADSSSKEIDVKG